jgi:hypothetical protein
MASLGYTLPGTIIEEIQNPASVNPTTTQRTPCFIGVASAYVKVTYEAVVRSSTGLTDSLEYTSEGIYEVIECGSQRGLSDYVEGTDFNVVGDEIVWTSSGIVTVGATYYVTYRYNRPSTDYIYKEFTTYEDVTTDLGDDIPSHPLVMISKLALRYFSLPKIAIVQVPATETSTDYANAIDATKYRDVQTICALTTNTTVQAYLINHVLERSLRDNGRYRITYMGMPAGTVIGSESDPTSLKGKAAAIRQERVILVNATRALYYYNDLTTNEETSTVVDGAFIAAVIAAYRDSFIHPTTTLLNKIISGIELYDEDYDDYYSEYQLTQAGESSVFLMAPSGGFVRVIDDLTTDNSTVERNNINIITAKDYIAKDVAIQMDRTFKGSLIKNRPNYAGVVQNYLQTLFKTYLNNNVIEQIGTLKVTLPSNRRDTVQLFYSYYSVYTHKFTEGTYTLEI